MGVKAPPCTQFILENMNYKKRGLRPFGRRINLRRLPFDLFLSLFDLRHHCMQRLLASF